MAAGPVPVKPERDELIGKTILGRYRIVWRLARGGMGVVYLARTEGAAGFVKPAVIKRILPDLVEEANMTKMFVREARILANLQHPGIVGVLDFGEQDNAYIMVLEYVSGYHLGRWKRYVRDTRGAFGVEVAVHILIKVLDALHYAHTFKRSDGKLLTIVHRDISPSNVLIDTEGHVKLVDFGIARVMGETAEYKTEELTVKGKFPYVAPEVFHGDQPSVQSDIYSCGVVLHELLVGHNEFRGNEMSDTLHRVLKHIPTRVAMLRSDVSKELDEVLQRALAKDPEDRYPSAAAFAHALREVRFLSEEEGAANLTEEVRQDFLGNLPKFFGIEPLKVLDAAWRNEPPRSGSTDDPTITEPAVVPISVASLPPSLEATVAETIDKGETRSYSRSKSNFTPIKWRKTVLWASLGLIACLAAVGITLIPSATPEPTPVYVVQQPTPRDTPHGPDVLPSNTSTASAHNEGKTSGTVTPPVVAPTPEKTREPSTHEKSPPRPLDSATRLSRTFARRRAPLEACFVKHASAVSGSPQVFVRVHVQPNGSVSEAELIPASLASTPLGSCVLEVARTTHFEQVNEDLWVRFPITVTTSH